MKKPFCCESSRHIYDQYYARQQRGEGDFPVYVGRTSQRGHGIGNIIGSLFRNILPVLKTVAPLALRTGANIIEDVSGGKTWKESALKQFPLPMSQSGSGIRRKRKRHTKLVKRIKRIKRRKQDIFSQKA